MITDLRIAGTPPPKLGAALVVVGATLHEAFAAQPNLKPEVSLRSCIMASLAVRDFMRRIGFRADVEPCLCYIEAYTILGECLHTLGIGSENDRPKVNRTGWAGHLVCVADGWLIDTTLYPARKRPMWELPGMIATPINVEGTRSAFGYSGMASLAAVDDEDGSYTRIRWLHQPRNKLWRHAPDVEPWRRTPVINRMFDEFNRLTEEAANAARQDSLER